MFDDNSYKGLKEKAIADKIKEEGFDPVKIINPPDKVYKPHFHPKPKLLVVLNGSMKVEFGGEKFKCGKCDSILIPSHMTHTIVSGSEGCTFFWSEKV